jgi:hypothetical protein
VPHLVNEAINSRLLENITFLSHYLDSKFVIEIMLNVFFVLAHIRKLNCFFRIMFSIQHVFEES